MGFAHTDLARGRRPGRSRESRILTDRDNGSRRRTLLNIHAGCVHLVIKVKRLSGGSPTCESAGTARVGAGSSGGLVHRGRLRRQDGGRQQLEEELGHGKIIHASDESTRVDQSVHKLACSPALAMSRSSDWAVQSGLSSGDDVWVRQDK